MDAKSKAELVTVIKDFIELGHVENIVSMYKADTSMYELTGDVLDDERFTVRLGVAVLFEELAAVRPQEVPLAIPSLVALLARKESYIRGEAASVLASINTKESLDALRSLKDDPDPQVVEIVQDALS